MRSSPRRSPSRRPSACSSTASSPRPARRPRGQQHRRSRSCPPSGRVPAEADRGRLLPLPGRRRGRAEHVQPERPRRLQHDRQGRAADPRPPRATRRRRRAGRRARGGGPAGRHDDPGGAADRPRQPPELRQHRRRRRPATALHRRPARGAPDLRPRPRRGVGDGRRAARLRRGRLHEDADGGGAPGRHGRPQPPARAGHRPRRRHRQVGLDGRLPLQHLRRRGRRRAAPGRPQDRHRQGGDPPRRRRADRPRRVRRRGVRPAAHWVIQTKPLGRSATSRASSRHHADRPDEHLRGARAGGRLAREGRPRPGATSSC